MNDKSDVSQYIALYPFTKNFFRKTFVQYVTVWLVRIWTYKNADEKAHTFWKRSKNVKKRTKNGYCVNSPSNCFWVCAHRIVYRIAPSITRQKCLVFISRLCHTKKLNHIQLYLILGTRKQLSSLSLALWASKPEGGCSVLSLIVQTSGSFAKQLIKFQDQ